MQNLKYILKGSLFVWPFVIVPAFGINVFFAFLSATVLTVLCWLIGGAIQSYNDIHKKE